MKTLKSIIAFPFYIIALIIVLVIANLGDLVAWWWVKTVDNRDALNLTITLAVMGSVIVLGNFLVWLVV